MQATAAFFVRDKGINESRRIGDIFLVYHASSKCVFIRFFISIKHMYSPLKISYLNYLSLMKVKIIRKGRFH